MKDMLEANIKEAEDAAAEVAALFPGFSIRPAMGMMPRGSYCYVESSEVIRFCAAYGRARQRVQADNQTLALERLSLAAVS